jgi:hypothetical protein
VLPGNNDRRVLIVIEAAKAATHSSLARPAMARGDTASEALTADSADEEGRRGSSSSASSDAASSFSCTYSPAPPDEWHKVAIIKTCVSVSADVAGGGKDQKPRGVVDAADRHGGASGTYTSANNPPIGLVSAGRAVSHTVVVRARGPARVESPEMEMMKERFSKLLLGEDMSGSGKGVCTALAISNAVTNLCGTYVTCARVTKNHLLLVGFSLA